METVKTLSREFGLKPVAFVVLLEVGARGVLYTGTTAVLLPFYREELLVKDSATYQAYSAVALLAWVVGKPVIGILSDSFPLSGYHKRWYLVLFGVVGCALLIGSSIVPSPKTPEASPPNAILFTLTMFIVTVCVVGIDLLVEGTYSAMIRSKKTAGSLLLSVAYGAATFGNITVSLIVGPLADSGHSRTVLLVMAPVALACAVPAYLNWARERPAGTNALHEMPGISAPHDTTTQERTDDPLTDSGARGECAWLSRYLGGSLKHHPRMAAMAIAVSCSACVVAVCVVTCPPLATLVVALVLLAGLVFLALRWLDRIVAKGVLAIVVVNSTYITIPGAMDYFYLADDKCVPGGPHFDYTYYQSFTAVITAIASGLGLILFQNYLVKRSYGSVVLLTSVAQGIASLFDVVMVTRANRTYLGLSDKATYFWGDAIIAPACAMMNFMPSVILVSRLCPPGVEAVMYALLASMMNYGLTISRLLGQQLIVHSGIKTTAPCDFSMLPWLIIITHLVVPVAFLPLAYTLLPAKRMDEELIHHEVGGNDGENVKCNEVSSTGTTP